MIILTESEVLDAAILFLKTYNELTKPDDSGTLMASLQRLRLKNSAILDDLNIWNEWEKSLVHYKQDKEKNSFTEAEAFEIFYDFLGAYYDRTQSDDIGSFLGDILHGQYGEVVDPAAWYDWQKCLKDVKNLPQ